MDALLDRLSASVTSAQSLEELVRPLLEMLEEVSGLDSTYLTVIDLERDEQRILYSRNTGSMTIPEGLAVPWGDTLCKRALDEGRPFTSNVSECWGDSSAAKTLGIQTYLSTPVYIEAGVNSYVDRGEASLGNSTWSGTGNSTGNGATGPAQNGVDPTDSSGTLFGTLCGASSQVKTPDPSVQRVLALFSNLIGRHIERERMLAKLEESNRKMEQLATTDPLTGLLNRRGLMQRLGEIRAANLRHKRLSGLLFLDLDGFKGLNDTYGHDQGDLLLQEVARRIREGVREEDVVGRLGGDEFVVILNGIGGSFSERTDRTEKTEKGLHSAACKILESVSLPYDLDALTFRCSASVGGTFFGSAPEEIKDILKRGDGAMYAAKKAGRNRYVFAP